MSMLMREDIVIRITEVIAQFAEDQGAPLRLSDTVRIAISVREGTHLELYIGEETKQLMLDLHNHASIEKRRMPIGILSAPHGDFFPKDEEQPLENSLLNRELFRRLGQLLLLWIKVHVDGKLLEGRELTS